MNLKAALLIFLVIFATAAATSFMSGISSRQICEKSVDTSESCRIVEIGNETLVQPNEPIDTPGGPG